MGHVVSGSQERLCPSPDGVNVFYPATMAFDPRLTSEAKHTVMLLAFFAGERDFCDVSDEDISASVDQPPSYAREAIDCLQSAGYVRVEESPAGRAVHLLWIYDTSMLPPMPDLDDPPKAKPRRRPKL